MEKRGTKVGRYRQHPRDVRRDSPCRSSCRMLLCMAIPRHGSRQSDSGRDDQKSTHRRRWIMTIYRRYKHFVTSVLNIVKLGVALTAKPDVGRSQFSVDYAKSHKSTCVRSRFVFVDWPVLFFQMASGRHVCSTTQVRWRCSSLAWP